MKPLGLIAGLGLGMSVVCFAAAAAMAPESLQHLGLKRLSNPPLPITPLRTLAQSGRREIAWSGGDTLTIAVPANVKLVPGGSPKLVLRGPDDVLDRVTLTNGKLSGDGVCWFLMLFCDGDNSRPVEIDVEGVALNSLQITGVANVELGHLDQDHLSLRVSGAGAVKGDGKVNDLALVLSGASHVDLAGLQTGKAEVVLSGIGDAEIAPSQDAKVVISGMGHVQLATKPQNLETSISGMGSVTGPGINRTRGNRDRNRDQGDMGASLGRELGENIGREVSQHVQEEIQAQHIEDKVQAKVKEKLKEKGL